MATHLHPVALKRAAGGHEWVGTEEAFTSHPVALGWKPTLCHWSRQSGGIRSAPGGQKKWPRKSGGTEEGQRIKE